jgi:carotenoid 1,2-hydratase
MTERASAQVHASVDCLRVGPSAVQWDGAAMDFHIDEIGCPLPAPVRGRVRLEPTILGSRCYALDEEARHLWSPLAPRARIEVRLTHPALTWHGEAYLDSNVGSNALEQDFSRWTWSRAALDTGSAVFYELQHRREAARSLALQFDASGQVSPIALPPRCTIRPSRWGIARATRSERPSQTRLLRTMVDAPFYVRSLLATQLAGKQVTSVHESVDLDRLRRPWVQWLLPFRMPRWPLLA